MFYIYADFMKMDHQGRLLLTTHGTFKDLKSNNLELEPGLSIVFYHEDEDEDEDENGMADNIVVQGVVDFDNDNQRWVAVINWDDIKNISQLSKYERDKYGL